jgi:5-methylcytosine-specific restriction protein A
MKLVFKKTDNKKVFDIDLIDDSSSENEYINFEFKVATNIENPPKDPRGSKNPKKKNVSSEQIIRDSEVHAWVLLNSKWICECCNNPSPFVKPDGKKYLEVHHLKRLADGGTDTIENAIAVCPNCHRELHYGSDRDDKLKLIYSKIERVKKE